MDPSDKTYLDSVVDLVDFVGKTMIAMSRGGGSRTDPVSSTTMLLGLRHPRFSIWNSEGFRWVGFGAPKCFRWVSYLGK
jgi:hypothetical protein